MRHPRSSSSLLAAALALTAAAGFGASVAWTRYTAGLGPLDLAASREGSTIVVDRDGRLLRPFTLPGGRWRLPATTHDVDARYLAMLVAYEDGRFYQHDGVDFRALVRAGAQWLMRGHVVSGGSTLPMQVARLIEPGPSARSPPSSADRARARDRARGRQAGNARPLSHARSVRRQSRGRAGGFARLFRQGAVEAHARRAALLVALPQSPEARRPDRSPASMRGTTGRVPPGVGERAYHRRCRQATVARPNGAFIGFGTAAGSPQWQAELGSGPHARHSS